MSTRVAVRKNSYKDSVRLLEATRAILGSPGVSWGWALMATPANLETLAEQGIAGDVADAAAIRSAAKSLSMTASTPR